MNCLERMKEMPVEMDFDEEFVMECSAKLGYARLRDDRDRIKALAALRSIGVHPFTDESVREYKKKAAFPNTFFMWWLILGAIVIAWPIVIDLMVWDHQWLAGFGLVPFWFIIGCNVINSLHKNWYLRPLSKYDQPVPEFVLQTALDVKNCPALNAGVFYIDQLYRSEWLLDPFLVFTIGGNTFYIEVWNEPQYKQQRDARGGNLL